MHERSYERDLELDLLAAKHGSAGQRRDLDKRASELLYGFDERRALQ